MLMTRPDDATLYAALLARDAAYEGQAWVMVTTTGVFCKLTCPARKPLARNCQFADSIAACLSAGYRPCKRCNPLTHPDPEVKMLLKRLDADPGARWSEPDLIALGLDPSTVRRKFKRHLGMTFLELARQRRLGQAFTAMRAGERVIDAQIAAGFESASAFRAAFARRIGAGPGQFRQNARLRLDWIDSPLGPLVAAADDSHLHLLEFIDRKALARAFARLSRMMRGDVGFGATAISDLTRRTVARYFAEPGAPVAVPLALHGTPFTRSVWRALQDIPTGETVTYAGLAARIGRPDATRAVARANGANQIAILIPCHRVLGADGNLTGYGGGLWRKQQLLQLEQNDRRART